MRGALQLLHFFYIVPPVPRLMVGAFAVVTVVSMSLVAMNPARAGGAMTSILLLQLFAASSGFAVPARRGHYDLLLTIGHSRAGIAAAHWAMSILPGVTSWLALGAAELTVVDDTPLSISSSGSMAAFVLVSTLPWAVTVSLPRFAGAIGWLVLVTLAAALFPDGSGPWLADSPGAGRSWFEAALTLVLYPPALVGEPIAGPQGFIVLPGLILSMGMMGCALAWVGRRDIPLEAAQ